LLECHLFRATVTFTAIMILWHDFAGKGVLNVLGGVLPAALKGDMFRIT